MILLALTTCNLILLKNDPTNAEDVTKIAVYVEQGWLEGEIFDLVTEDGQYFSFKGIPYAAPPIGNLRFKSPQPPAPWNGVKKATKDGSSCVQGDNINQGNEDCLYLNVFSTDINPETLMPVMVFIHGGGFIVGSSKSEVYGPDFLIPHGVVLVSFNYRLNSIGFLSTESQEIPGNFGLKDQVAALQWVQRNIKTFGGDPENVTIFGQSAGSVSVIYLMTSPLATGLFNRVIAMSGVPSSDWAIPYQPRRRAFELGKYLGFNTDNDTELLNFLLNVPAETLANTKPNVLASENVTGIESKMYYFVPVVETNCGDERVVIEDALTAMKEGHLNQADLMIGLTNSEGIANLDESTFQNYSLYPELLDPRIALYSNTPDNILNISDAILEHYFGSQAISNKTASEFVQFYTDSTYGYQVYRNVETLLKTTVKNIFVYIFSKVSDLNLANDVAAKYKVKGASHLDDLTYIFAGASNETKHSVDVNSEEYKMIQQVSKLYTNFAKFGNPTPDSSLGTTWPVYNGDTKAYLDIGELLTPKTGFQAEVVPFWKSIFDRAGLEFI